MRIKTAVWSLLLAALLAAAASGQKAVSAPKFTSVYTSLGKGCKTLRGSNGSDPAFICKGVGGYQTREYSAAAASFISAELKGNDESFPLVSFDLGLDTSKAKLEWRLADGKPFAVILRVPKYADPTGSDQYFGKVIGYKLVVKGLKGFDIDDAVDANTNNANAKARKIADTAFATRH